MGRFQGEFDGFDGRRSAAKKGVGVMGMGVGDEGERVRLG